MTNGVTRVAGIVLVLALAAALPACAPKAPPSAAGADAQPVPVTVAPVKSVTLPRTVPVVGTLNGYEDVMLAPKVDGRVLRVLKDVGDPVLPGEVLLELDPTDHRLAAEQARAALEAELRKLKLDALPETDAAFAAHLPKVDAVAQARANLELAQKELARQEFEQAKGVGSGQLLDTAKSRAKVAEAAVELALTDARVTLAQARRLKAAHEDAQEKLRETALRAPGRPEWAAGSAVVGTAASPVVYSVAARMVSKGEMIRQFPSTNAFRLVVDHVLKLRVTVPEKFKPEVRVGQPVAIRVKAHPDRTFAGTVSRVNPTVDPATRAFTAEVEVPNHDRALAAGGFAQAEIRTHTDADVLTVPPEAVISFAGVTKVFVADRSVARAVEVELGTREKDWVEVKGALKPGDRVITSGQTQLVGGSPIRVR
jgi:multidrug efflux pump subunit AcrA (membrane-fusion protein)